MQRWLAAECHGAVPCLSTHPHVALRYAVADSSQERTERKEAAWSNAALGATIGGLCLWAACTRGKQARHRQRGVTRAACKAAHQTACLRLQRAAVRCLHTQLGIKLEQHMHVFPGL